MPPPCGHNPIKARAGQPYNPSLDCLFCHYFLHSAPHNRDWGGDGQVHAVTRQPSKADVPLTPVPQESARQHPGWGDRAEQALSAVGITKERVAAWLGRPCNCLERQEKLNRLGRWVEGWFSGESKKEHLEEMTR